MRMRFNKLRLKMDVNASSSSSLMFTDSNSSSGSTSSSSSISGDNLITKTKSVKSAVWKYFGYKEETALCRICHKAVAARGGNTSNLISHLKIHHPLKHEEFRKVNAAKSQYSTTTRSTSKTADGKPQLSILDSIEATQKYDRNGRKWQKLTDAVVLGKICYLYTPLRRKGLLTY